MDVRHRLLALLALLLTVVTGGTVGYVVIEGWSIADALYMTIITITTVGYGEVNPLSGPGRILTSVVILAGVGGVIYTASTVFEYLFEAQLGERRQRRRMEAQIARLHRHFIICGFGRVGEEIGATFRRENADFVVVEEAPDRTAELRRLGYLYVEGDATRDDVLGAAGLTRARGIVATTGSDADNTYITLLARQDNPNAFIVARADLRESEAVLRRAGADRVIMPHAIGGRRMALLALRPLVIDFIDTIVHDRNVDIGIAEVMVAPNSPIAGSRLEEASRDHQGVTVLAVRKPDGSFNYSPSPDTRIEAGDALVVFGSEDRLRALEG